MHGVHALFTHMHPPCSPPALRTYPCAPHHTHGTHLAAHPLTHTYPLNPSAHTWTHLAVHPHCGHVDGLRVGLGHEGGPQVVQEGEGHTRANGGRDGCLEGRGS